jgi:putative oxidoreductase
MAREDVGRLLLRLTVAGLLLLHGLYKLRHGLAGVEGLVVAHGLPRFVAFGAVVGEVLAPLCMIVGLWSRVAAGVVAFNMVVAVWLGHAGDVLHLGKTGGYALELHLLYIVGAISCALLGSGRYAARPD